MIRKPAVAGQFYSGSPSGLLKEVQKYIEPSAQKVNALGVLSPHAGLMYSGAVAGAVYSRAAMPHTIVLIGPNHTGMGRTVSVMAEGRWEIPTGALRIDSLLARKIIEASDVIEEDDVAHLLEHSLEVQLPFILYFSRDVEIVPITMMTDSLSVCKAVGEAVAQAVKDAGYPVMIAASSDMTHYETDSSARAKDKKALGKILNLDPEGLYKTVRREGISMCGVIPAATMLYAVKKLEAKGAELVKYMTSGDVSGDYDHVVGYAGIIIK
ncbi:MAG: AmmeMemoRadiSam system protein B [Nitrospirae bacterium]|nr:AmmeMemoRadiSam system protein B [Nitrospirota bacterium]